MTMALSKRFGIALGFLLLAALSGGISCRKHSIPETVVDIDPIQQRYLDWQRRGSAAIPEIVKLLNEGTGGDFRLRTHALLALGKIGERRMAPLIVETLGKDPNAAVKNCAIIALADLKYTDGVPILIQLLNSKDTVTDPLIVVESLGRLGDDRAVPVLIALLKSDNATLALKAQNALAEIHSPRAVPELLALQTGTGRYDKEIAVILGMTDHPASGPALLAILNTKGSPGQIAAATGVGERRYAPAMQSLVDWLSGSEEELLQRKCGEALGKLNLPASVPPLIALFDRPSFLTRMIAAEALSSMTIPGVGPAAHEKLRAASPAAIAPAAFVLGEKKYTPAVPMLQAFYKASQGVDAFLTAQALGKIGDRSSIPLLLEGLDKRTGEAAHGAAYALGALRAQEAVDPMIRLLKSSKDLVLKKHVVAALGEIGDRRAVPSILALPAGDKLEMADLIGRSLGRLGGDESWKFMEAGLNSDDDNDKRVARMILTNVREKEKVPRLLKLLDNEDVQTRKAAMVSLRRLTGKDFGTEREWIDWSNR